MDRFIFAVKTLPDAVRRRLVVENDGRLFDADEALAVGKRRDFPVVFDWLHHRARVDEIGMSAGGPRDMMDFLHVAPAIPFDCMLEAKQKDQALLRLREALDARGIVETTVTARSR